MSKIRAAYERIKDKDDWCTGFLAVDAEGNETTYPNSHDAQKWCALGALVREYDFHQHVWKAFADTQENESEEVMVRIFGRDFYDDFMMVMGKAEDLYSVGLTSLNDNIGHEAVMQVYEKAIVETEGSL